MEKEFVEVNLDTIQVLKARGFKNIELNLLLSNDRIQSTVEVIPGSDPEFQINKISLSSKEIMDYFEVPSPRAKYVIDQSYL